MKKINFILLLPMIMVFSCTSQMQNTKDFILEFEKELLLNEKTNIQSIKKYIDLHPNMEKSIHFKEMLSYYNNSGKELNKNTDLKIKVLSFEEASKTLHYTDSYSFKKLKYENKKNVYYVIFPSIEDKIGGTIIVNNQGKIISFYCYFRTGSDPVVPFMLNEKPTIDWLGKPFK